MAAVGPGWKSVLLGAGLGQGAAGCFGQTLGADMRLQQVPAVSSSFTIDLIHEDSTQVQHHPRCLSGVVALRLWLPPAPRLLTEDKDGQVRC